MENYVFLQATPLDLVYGARIKVTKGSTELNEDLREHETCTTARSDPPEAVIHRATYLFENGYFEYDLMKNNCEDFALYCKTGLWSEDKGKQGSQPSEFSFPD
ncbi:hypothetical protein L1987_56147 [Smallanthus sonchifolius]|uniref:Uncharacterized protein n=1 Tax=Smallanthus sonchifolius TaxID=185202 RepID=A0ACB9ED06_9ASTR|nr:hypothetical protein L1987_56147 [Smallanthus sonchifolius]